MAGMADVPPIDSLLVGLVFAACVLGMLGAGAAALYSTITRRLSPAGLRGDGGPLHNAPASGAAAAGLVEGS